MCNLHVEMYDYVLRVCLCVYQSVVSLLCGQGLLKKILTPAGIKPSTETPSVSVFYRAYLNISAFFFVAFFQTICFTSPYVWANNVLSTPSMHITTIYQPCTSWQWFQSPWKTTMIKDPLHTRHRFSVMCVWCVWVFVAEKINIRKLTPTPLIKKFWIN